MIALPVTLKRIHAQRLREVYRSAGWPYQDVVEIDLLATGLLERVTTDSGHAVVRLTVAGIQHLASATQGNRQARSAHEALVDKVVESMLREGRIAWTGLSLRAKVAGVGTDDTHWKMCQPDVFSIRNSSRQDYLEPIVHEIKVNRSDLLGDLKRPEKRGAYLDVGGQCWYVLGCDRTGHPIANPLHNRFAIAPETLTKKGSIRFPFWQSGAGKETRTLDLYLGKVSLYQLSYSRVSSPRL